MRLTGNKVDSLTEQIVEMLQSRQDSEMQAEASQVRVWVRQAMVHELMVEDRLEEEVRQVLQQYDYEIRRGRMNYNTLFNRIKSKLVRERGLVL